jgi:hypothetical protein
MGVFWGLPVPIFLGIRTAPVDLLESSQGSMRVCWKQSFA